MKAAARRESAEAEKGMDTAIFAGQAILVTAQTAVVLNGEQL